MPEINVRNLRRHLEDTFRRYLFTLNFLPESERELREAFRTALNARDVFSRDPLLSVIPSYEPAESLADLMARSEPPFLHAGLAALAQGGFDPLRPLYNHQVRSIALAQRGHNIVVATGTGSGKTECFLLPVLDDALRHPGPGVRAIIVYPLNALANDQLSRLRKVLRGAPDITFGRYTGDTKWNDQEASREELNEVLRPNERFTRAEIRSDPPHLLLTNFAMLEYLLLRPKDTDVFKQQRLRFVILDEAHVYSGAQGIDVSLLMRRLREAFPHCELQFILTSATMGSDSAAIAEFGRKLTGHAYYEDDVVLGTQANAFAQEAEPPLPLADYLSAVPDEESPSDWLRALDDVPTLKDLAKKSRIPVPADAGREATAGAFLAAWLRKNRELQQMHELASAGPITLADAARKLWGSDDPGAIRVCEWMLSLGSHAVFDPELSPPLLPVRYHFFFRGVRSASICLSSACPERASHQATMWSNLVLDDPPTCPSCGAGLLPLLTCVHCGTPFIRIAEVNQRWQAIEPGVSADIHILTWTTEMETEDEEGAGDETQITAPAQLCLRCRAISLGGQLLLTCCDSPDIADLRVVVAKKKKADGLLTQCPICAGRAQPFPTVLRDFGTGEDAASAVLAEATIRELPLESPGKPAGGRRLLCFSDSRQRAAYFAPYLGRTTAETQYMKPLLDAILLAARRSGGTGASFGEIADAFAENLRNLNYVVVREPIGDSGEYKSTVKRSRSLLPADKRELKRQCLISLFQHFTASPRNRQNLPGLALAHLQFAWTDEERETLPERLPWLFAGNWEAGDASLQWCLRVFAWRRALIFPEGIRLQQIGAGPETATFHRSDREAAHGRQMHRWNPYFATARRELVIDRSPQAEIVARSLGVDKRSAASQVSDALDSIWTAFRDLSVIDQVSPNEFQLNSERLLVSTEGIWLACGRCGMMTVHPVRRACVMPGCGGALSELTLADIHARFSDHHWYERYTQTQALPIEVREHTAQLTNTLGADYQHQFMDGTVNVLSSSTTFEMGVDVGQLKAIFLRNVPPTPANYVQRAGRAGRRREGAAFAITYCRSIPHDQTHFLQPENVVHGEVPVPRISLANRRLTQRHVNSFLLGAFLRSPETSFRDDLITVGQFFLEPTPDTSPAARFETWIESKRTSLILPLRRIISPEASLDPEDALRCSAAELRDACRLLQDRLEGYERQKQEAKAQLAAATGTEIAAAAKYLQSAERLTDELRNKERLIDFLASEPHWLPGYAFPQDVVRLLVRQDNRREKLRLERDLEYGIAEYAPGAEVIANGWNLVSGGIDLQNRELEVRFYRVCSGCNRVERGSHHDDIPRQCPTCGTIPTGRRAKTWKYIVPRGFTTLIDDPIEDVRLYRLKPPPNSEVFLVEGAEPDTFQPHPTLTGIIIGHRTDGQLFRANSGPKGGHFSVCPFCGHGKRTNGVHKKPWGPDCSGGKITTDLVCEFRTDTLQIRFNAVQPAPPPVSDRSFWLSLQTAFIAAAADTLVVPRRDLDGTFRSQGEGSVAGELVIYDRVPGGAGYVGRIREELPEILMKTLKRVGQCPNSSCQPQGSCYACLRTYGNQFDWDLLRRDRVEEWLSSLLSGQTRASGSPAV